LVQAPSARKLHGAGGLTERDAEGALQAVGVEAEELPGRRRGAEDAAGGRRVVTAVIMGGRVEGQAQADLHLVAGDAGRDQVTARGAGHLGCRQCRGDDGCGGVDRAFRVGVVEIEGMGQRAVDHGRRRRRVAARIPEDGAIARRLPEALHGRHQARCRFGVVPGSVSIRRRAGLGW